VAIDLTKPQPATPEELANVDYISPSAMIDSTDDAVMEVIYMRTYFWKYIALGWEERGG
jgi:hypothetical protein